MRGEAAENTQADAGRRQDWLSPSETMWHPLLGRRAGPASRQRTHLIPANLLAALQTEGEPARWGESDDTTLRLAGVVSANSSASELR